MNPAPTLERGDAVLPPLAREDLDHVLQGTLSGWEELRGQSLFITGGTGFFGHWLLETFTHANDVLGLGARATVLTRNPAALARKSPHLARRADLTWLTGDVRSFPFPAGEFSYVIHAGTTSSAPVAPLEMFDTITLGTRRVLDFAASHGTRKLLFISSGAVYGKQPPEMTHLPEDYCGAPDPMDPLSAYGEGKRTAEMLCALMSRKHGFEAKIARCFAFVGPHLPLNAHFAVGNFIGDALAGGPIRVGGDGTPYRSYLYAADLSIWLWTLLFRGQSLRAYNIGSPAALSISDLARGVGELFGVKVDIARAADPRIHPACYVPCTERASLELGLHVGIELRDAIMKTVSWQNQTPAGSIPARPWP